ncbi:MAG: protein-glutamate O-methyltransferase CheR [Gammaproteobacteria bacterium]|nr:protein-glutamate O-methyltransferase CheR [Gammaproteobacteria bacterium]
MPLYPVNIIVEREFRFTANDFEFLRDVVNRSTGIVVTDEKEDMFYSRLARRIRRLGLDDFKQYCDLLKNDEDGIETAMLANAITTNLTSFFREEHHFHFLSQTVFPELAKTSAAGRRLRIWSAGCSTGEEPHSIAVTICESELLAGGWDVRILATDVNSEVLAQAAEGIYSLGRIEGIHQQRIQQWFLKGKGGRQGMVRVKPEVRRLIDFAELNLISAWSLPEPVDFVFCRNVIIYFNSQTKKILVDRIADNLNIGGYLFLGHSESLFMVSERFELISNTVYRKKY